MRIRLPPPSLPAMLVLMAMLYPTELVLARMRAPWWIEAPVVLGVVLVFLHLIRVDGD